MFKYRLSPEEQARVQAEYRRRRKQPLVAWLLLPVCGWIGGHRFYLEDCTGGILRAIYSLLLAAAVYATNHFVDLELYYIVSGAFLLLVTLLVIDAAILPAKIRQVNNRIEADIIIRVSQKMRPREYNGAYSWPVQKNTGS